MYSIFYTFYQERLESVLRQNDARALLEGKVRPAILKCLRYAAKGSSSTKICFSSPLGVDFHYSDLSGQQFDGQTFLGVTFDLPGLKDVSFQGATLKNVAFRPVGIWSLKRAIQSMNFAGALMDKLTYAALKGLGADVSKW